MKYMFIFAFIIGCHCQTPSDIDSKGNVIGTPGNQSQQQSCDLAQKNLLSPTLQCHDSKGLIIGGPNQNGEPFTITCQQLLVHKIPVNTDCLSKARSCDEVRVCEGGK